MAVASGMHDVVLVIGAERMREVNNLEATDFVATLTHPLAEYIYGVTLPSLAGMFTRLYMEKYGVTARHLAMVAVKNHDNAHGQLLRAPARGDHARGHPRFAGGDDQQPHRRRAAAVLRLLPGLRRRRLRDPGLRRRSPRRPASRWSGWPASARRPTRMPSTSARTRPTCWPCAAAAEQSFEMAGRQAPDVHVAELHDAFTILEIVESEEVGFFKKGQGHLALRRARPSSAASCRSITSGGLKAKGHPVGATGVGQAHEIVLQLRGEAEKRQVKDAKVGFTCNFGGFGNNVVCLTFMRED